MTVSQSIPIVIAAGGKGRRMVVDKPTQTLGGVSLIELALRRALSMSAKVAVAVQQEPSWPVLNGVEYLYDDRQDAGPLSALSSALIWGGKHRASHVLLIPCDMPFLPHALLSRFMSQIDNAAVAIAKSGDRLHPICGLWPVVALSVLPDYAQNSRRSLIGFAERLGTVEVEWAVDAVDPFFNINTPDDLAHAGRLLASGAISS